MTLPAHEIPIPGPADQLSARIRDLVPEIETERLRLRAPTLADVDAYAEIACGPRGRGIGGPMSRDDAFRDFAMMVAGWTLRGHGLWTIEPKAGGEPLGFALIGFEPGDREPELGFMLREPAEGRGYAFEAASAARAFGFGRLGLPSMVSWIEEGNARSRALAERLGAALDEFPDVDAAGEVVYRHPHAAAPAAPGETGALQ